PVPADGDLWRLGVDTELSWTPGLGALTHDVYISADKALVDARDASVASAFWLMDTFAPGDLEINTTYYWAVDEFTGAATIPGPTWTFDVFAFDPHAITDSDLLIHYGFETGSGEMVDDLSGHENYGFLKGAPQWTTGIYGGGLDIDIATLDYVETGAPLGITSNTITVSGWVIHDESPAGWSGILTTRGSGNLGLQHDGTELRYMWGPDLYWSFSSGLALPNGEWYFAALAVAPDQATLYLNGVDANSTATNVAEHGPVDFDSLIRVGRDHNDGRIMTSTIDDVRLYNRTLTAQEILWVRDNLADVTGADDVVQGDPNDGDWPGGEYPALAIDDDVTTKFLH
ncbi:MAG: LamG domain-containing protein, partial [Planctomycetes bacterium]|nr:LamG domain-containing protein [Planctomycetota bacterium]